MMKEDRKEARKERRKEGREQKEFVSESLSSHKVYKILVVITYSVIISEVVLYSHLI
jgi:hypothetical protein